MPRRRWGKSNLSIPVIPYGTQGFGNHFGDVAGEAASGRPHPSAIDLGVNHFDCARCYGDFLRKLGPGPRRHPPRALHRLRPALPAQRPLGAPATQPGPPPTDAVRDVEDQLDLLGIEYFDAVLVHDPPEMGPVLAPGGALEGLLRLKEQGKVRNVGFGMRPHDFHQQALATGLVDVMLTFSDYNLLRRSRRRAGRHPRSSGRPGRRRAQRLLHHARHPHRSGRRRGRRQRALPERGGHRPRPGDAPWAIDRGVSLLAIALQFCLEEGRIQGNPLGNQNPSDLEQNVEAVATPLPPGVLEEFRAVEAMTGIETSRDRSR